MYEESVQGDTLKRDLEDVDSFNGQNWTGGPTGTHLDDKTVKGAREWLP